MDLYLCFRYYGKSEVESPETVDEVGQLHSDIQQEEDEIMDDLNESLEDQSLELSDEKLRLLQHKNMIVWF